MDKNHESSLTDHTNRESLVTCVECFVLACEGLLLVVQTRKEHRGTT